MINQKTLAELSKDVAQFFPKVQLQIIIDACFDHENDDWQANQQYYRDLLQGFAEIFQKMPKTYETNPAQFDENGNEILDEDASSGGNAIAYLHYFVGGCDWWITEKDMEEEQLQAFGVVKLGNNRPEFGYINLVELSNNVIKHSSGMPLSVELDFHWQPKRLKDIPELASLFFKTRL